MAKAWHQRHAQWSAGCPNGYLARLQGSFQNRAIFHNGRKPAGFHMRVKEFYQWLIDLADATDGAPIDLPSAEHAFLMGRTVAQYLETLK
jgi:uncharacterized Fe-S cluster-containing radical SAM superfamily enzyme